MLTEFLRWEMGGAREVEREGGREREIGCLPYTPRPGTRATTLWCTYGMKLQPTGPPPRANRVLVLNMRVMQSHTELVGM